LQSFIVDLLPARDEDLLVDGLLQELQAAAGVALMPGS